MPQRKGLLAPQNTFLDTIATRFDGTHSNFVLGNAQVKEYPIVYCSDGFVELTGFGRSQIMSRSCSCTFLWGPLTEESAKDSIWSALKVHTELKIEVMFHKKNGNAFRCLLDIVPIKNEKGQVVLFLVSHKDLTTQKKPSGNSTSLLSCGLASTVTAAALVTKRQPELMLPSGNRIPSRVVPVRRAITPSSTLRRASAPHVGRDSTPRVRFGSCFGIQNESVGLNSRPPLRSQSEAISAASATPNASHAPNHFLTDTESISGSSKASSSKKPETETSTTPSSSSSSSSSRSSGSDDDDSQTAYKFQRRRSRAVLYHLSGQYAKKNKHHKLNFKRVLPQLSTKNSMPEYKVQDLKASRCILLHYSILKIVWDWLIVLCTFYFAVMVPYNAAFQRDTNERSLRTLDMIIEVLFIVDILLNFRTTYVSKSGQVVHQSRAVALNYIRGWLLLDLIAAVPFDVIWTIQSPESPVANWMHLMKLARLLRLARLFQKIERYSQYSAVVLGILMCMFFLLAHWFACGWFGLGSRELLNLATRNHSWLYELSERTDAYYGANMTGGPSRSSIYISSLYFMMSSLTSVGFGNVSPNTSNEKVFSIIAMLVGALMHAAVFGNVTTIIQRMYTRRSTYQTKYQDLKDFTRAHHLPKQLRQRMLEFYQAMWSINRGIDKQTIMQVFPEEMRGDIALHINREMLSLSVFKSASIGCQKSIAQLIETRFATPGEFLVHKGDAIKNLYFVCSGSLEILGESGSVVALLGKCDLFGTDIDDRPFIGLSAYDVKALTYCELQYLVLDSTLFCILDLYPAYSKEFSAALHDELSFNIKEGYDPFAHDEVETLAAITKPQCSPQESSRASLKPPLEISSGSQIRSSVSSLQRSVEEGDPNLSPDPCGSHEHLLGRARGNRWYLPSSVDYDDPDETFKRRVSMNGAGTKIALTLRDNRRHFSLGEICDGKTNPPIGPFLSSCRESEGSNSARQLCSMEVVNERFLNETTQNRAPPPSPCTTSLPADPSCEVQVSKCEPDELKDLLCKLIQDVQEMRVELRSLATDVSILKHQQHQQKQQQQQDQHVTGLNSSPQRSVPKASIMKSPTTPNFTVDQSPESTNSSEDGFGKKGSRSLISTGGNVFFSSTCSQPRCVKFNLPEKPRKINMERHLHVLDKRRGSSEVSSSSSDALIGLSSAAENRK